MSKLLLKRTREVSAGALIAGAVILLSFFLVDRSRSAAPTDGTLAPGGANVTWNGNATGGPQTGGEDCVDGFNCDTFLLTLSGNPSDWIGKNARVAISWPNGGDDFDVYIHKGDNTGPIVGSAAAGGPGPEIVNLDPNAPGVGTGVFSVHVVYFFVIPGDQYQGVASSVTVVAPTPTPGGTATPAPLPPGTARFFNYYSPQGVANDAAEPSIGINWNTEKKFSNSMFNDIPNGGTSLYFGGLLFHMLKITFDDCSSPAGALWEQKPLSSAAAPRPFSDPILFTDHITGRTFVSQQFGLSPAGSTTEYTDNDGDTFSPSEGGAPSCIDHQTLGGGPFHAPIPPGVNPLYPHAVYYASHCGVPRSRSSVLMAVSPSPSSVICSRWPTATGYMDI
ncbi:MAG: hypothetical protein M3Q89_06580 [Verrucomicrobiota bacterium]|nr:hypothetical protein [Verrucomicrobiota bacterium]